jgi:phage baseplate assembly protein W
MTGFPAFPYRIDQTGATATENLSAHVASLVRLVLQTEPGERVNRPTFGGGLKKFVFEGMDGQMAAAAETMIRGVLLRWLGNSIVIDSLTVTAQGSEARVTLTYSVRQDQQKVTQTIAQGLAP